MAGNSFGQLYKLMTYGESHGAAIGGVIDGCPAGIEMNAELVQKELDRRRPGQSSITTPRTESDTVELLSGVFDGKTTGAPIGFIIRNGNQRSGDYDHLKDVYRPGHADHTWDAKFGFRDYRGGGRSSARETAARVVGGAIAKEFLQQNGVSIKAYVSRVKDIAITANYDELDLTTIENNIVRCPDEQVALQMIALIEEAKQAGDSVGGLVTCVCSGIPSGLGEPVFDRLDAVLAHAMLSINATKGFEMYKGFDSTYLYGSENNQYQTPTPEPIAKGQAGIAGGISTGQDIVFNVAFKPVSTISKPQQTTDVNGKEITLEAKGRHDPCVLPRAVPIVEAMAAMVLMDMILLARSNKI
jgi:chorismate synthase